MSPLWSQIRLLVFLIDSLNVLFDFEPTHTHTQTPVMPTETWNVRLFAAFYLSTGGNSKLTVQFVYLIDFVGTCMPGRAIASFSSENGHRAEGTQTLPKPGPHLLVELK